MPKNEEEVAGLIADLRSGKYPQGRDRLVTLSSDDNPEAYCCLGVATVRVEHELGLLRETMTGGLRFVDARGTGQCTRIDLLESVRAHYGFTDRYGTYSDADGVGRALMQDNDEGKTFAEIADIIESNPEGLFET